MPVDVDSNLFRSVSQYLPRIVDVNPSVSEELKPIKLGKI